MVIVQFDWRVKINDLIRFSQELKDLEDDEGCVPIIVGIDINEVNGYAKMSLQNYHHSNGYMVVWGDFQNKR